MKNKAIDFPDRPATQAQLQAAHHAQIAQLPCWTGPLTLVPLSGGMTNHNYLATHNGQQFVVRLGRDVPEHGVMAFNSLALARAAYCAGLSPEVVFAAEGVTVSRFIHGRSLTAPDLRDPARLDALIALLHRCHHQVPLHLTSPALTFWVFQVIRSYASQLRQAAATAQAFALVDRLPELLQRAAQLEQWVGPVTLVLGHNDLLAANLIDDGQRLWLIDWDYGGFNSPLFDLANLSSNNGFSPAQDRALLAGYFMVGVPNASKMQGDQAVEQHWRAFSAMKCASLLREMLWGAVSQITSQLQVDYTAYTADYAARLEVAWGELQSLNG